MAFQLEENESAGFFPPQRFFSINLAVKEDSSNSSGKKWR
jgi:hypothetical protein